MSTSFSPSVGGGEGAATPAVQLNSIFSAKTDPRENPVKNPEQKQQHAQQINFTHLANKF
jgi:hypothetical protein